MAVEKFYGIIRMMELLKIDSLALAKMGEGTSQGVSSIWMWIAIIEGFIILTGLVWNNYRKTPRCQIKSGVLQEDMDLGNIFNSAFNAEPLYKELTRMCHPDRFAPDEDKMQIADELFQLVTKNRNNIKELLKLKELVKHKLNIKL